MSLITITEPQTDDSLKVIDVKDPIKQIDPTLPKLDPTQVISDTKAVIKSEVTSFMQYAPIIAIVGIIAYMVLPSSNKKRGN